MTLHPDLWYDGVVVIAMTTHLLLLKPTGVATEREKRLEYVRLFWVAFGLYLIAYAVPVPGALSLRGMLHLALSLVVAMLFAAIGVVIRRAWRKRANKRRPLASV